ncbi:MAG: acetyl-CoA carboxylase carboxyltransferase subunit alpha [Eubacterium sp.]|nr:acetyl-CoA carboxylase carboxyltransferase subunit alpha [Eubacterium sp.]
MRQKQLTPYERLEIARDIKRPKVTDYIDALFDDFIELSGDRLGKEDASILGGIAFFEGMPVTVIGHRKGANLEENIKYNFGMPGPEGYRKALRLMKQAEKFKRPVITFVDTPGAYPGKEAEENGQSIAIAENLAEMSALKVPIITIVTGEGNSGGALAISVADEIWMLENAVYSVLSPEGFASILWKDAKRSKEACEVMKMTAEELYAGGLCDQVIPEAEGGIQEDFSEGCMKIRKALRASLPVLIKTDTKTLLEKRYQKYRHIEGEYHAIRRKVQ